MKTLKAQHRAHGGVHPAYCKDVTQGKPIERMPLPSVLRVSMSQHLGAPARPIVKKGDALLRGQPLGEAAGYVSAAVHAPTSGTVRAILEAPTPTGLIAPAVEIEPDGADREAPAAGCGADWPSRSVRDLVPFIVQAGVVGMGGAGFPTHVKLSPPPDKPVDTLIINGAECEPWLTADHRLMLEEADGIWVGAAIIRKILGAKTVRIAIEDNKPDAIAAMEKAVSAADGDVAVSVLRTRYPQGAEKQQIHAICGREVPTGGLPMDVGCLVENVATTLAVRAAVVDGKPLTERVTTLTGSPVTRPGNVLARIGAPCAELLAFCGGLSDKAAKLVAGGPMMGFAQHALDVGIGKTTSGLLFLPPEAVVAFSSMPCIACGRCVEACPMMLMPSELSHMIEAEAYEAAEGYDVMDCIECGCCAYVCPAHRPMVQHMKRGKAWVMARRAAARAEKK